MECATSLKIGMSHQREFDEQNGLLYKKVDNNVFFTTS